MKISSTNLYFRARELNFWEKAHIPPLFICQVSHVRCQVSHVICHVSHFTRHMSHVTYHIYLFFIYIFSDKVVNLVSGGFVINGAYPSSFVNVSFYLIDIGAWQYDFWQEGERRGTNIWGAGGLVNLWYLADKGEGGGLDNQFFFDIICEQPLTVRHKILGNIKWWQIQKNINAARF